MNFELLARLRLCKSILLCLAASNCLRQARWKKRNINQDITHGVYGFFVCVFVYWYYTKEALSREVASCIVNWNVLPYQFQLIHDSDKTLSLIRAYIWRKILFPYQHSANISCVCLLNSLNELCLRAKGIDAAPSGLGDWNCILLHSEKKF